MGEGDGGGGCLSRGGPVLDKEAPPPRTLQQAYAYDPTVVLAGGYNVVSYERGTLHMYQYGRVQKNVLSVCYSEYWERPICISFRVEGPAPPCGRPERVRTSDHMNATLQGYLAHKKHPPRRTLR